VEFKLHQALFGYDGGHQLLAASTRLPTDAKHLLAVATDSSGSAPATGFDQVYTGMPLPGTEFYALFSTWLAPEMSRPGCVWSHVLLVELADLAQLVDIGELRQFFRRPKRIEELAWREPVNFASQRITATPVSASLRADCRQFLESLYGAPESPAVLEAPDSGTYSDLVFAIWSQQWPRLRRSFRFSTGSFGDRGRSGPAFDLQVIPSGSRGAWQRGIAQKLPVTTSSPVAGPEPSRNDWLGIAINDLSTPDKQGFRTFLRTHGLDVAESRSAFARLATAYNLLVLHPISDWTGRLRSVGAIFPAQSDAIRLKESLFALREAPNVQENVDHASAMATFLLEDPEAAPYASVSVDHGGLALLLWKKNRDFVISLLARLVRRGESPPADSFAEGVAQAVDSASLRDLAENHSELVPLVIRHNPALAFEIDTWKLSGHIQTQVYETLAKLSLGQPDWARIVGAMFIAETDVSVREAVAMAGQFAMSGAFRWLDDQVVKEVLPSHVWRDALASPAVALLAQTKDLLPAQLALSAWCAPAAEVRRALSASREDVQRLADESPDAIPAPLRVSTAFLLLTIGLRESSDAATNMILRNFFTVHEALAARAHSSDSWCLLSPELPTLGWWRDWDLCERLRRAVHRSLAQCGASKRLRESAKTSDERKIARKVAESGNDDFSPEFLH